jgi:1-aminocyclopropane-1-carboxylate deaminase/D-cysteine desulfhydrase-like pyridoxal-dependent ACC family enzyme
MICDTLPRIPLALLPTPYQEATRLSAALGGPRIFIKRDDLAGLGFGGNKARLMEFVMGAARRDGCDAVVASSSVQSNKLREIAVACNRLGLRCVLCLQHGDPRAPRQGNLLLYDLLGVELRFLSPQQSEEPRVLEAQQAVQAQLEAQGHRVYVMDRRLEYGALAAAAYVAQAEELARQAAKMEAMPHRVCITVGAGMTAAGLILGLKHLGCPARVDGVCTERPAGVLLPEILDHARRAAELLEVNTRVEPEDVRLFDQYLAPGYGRMTPAVAEAIRLTAKHEGIFLDPVYTGKTMAALIDRIRRGDIDREECVAFVHTGGVPALFAYSDELVGKQATPPRE